MNWARGEFGHFIGEYDEGNTVTLEWLPPGITAKVEKIEGIPKGGSVRVRSFNKRYSELVILLNDGNRKETLIDHCLGKNGHISNVLKENEEMRKRADWHRAALRTVEREQMAGDREVVKRKVDELKMVGDAVQKDFSGLKKFNRG